MTHERASAPSESQGWDRPTLALLGVLGLLIFVYGNLIASSASLVPGNDHSTAEEVFFAPRGGSPVLVFCVAALLLYSRVRALRASLAYPPSLAVGTALVALAALLAVWSHYIAAPDLMIPSLIFMLMGSAALLGGQEALRIIAAPSAFLIFAFPLPAALVNELVWPLQLSTAQSASGLLAVLGDQPKTWGDIILVRGKAFHVIETCSGMGMIQTLLMAAALYAILFYRSRTQAILILLAAPLIAYWVNVARVISIVLNPYATWSSVHTTQGIATIVAGVLLIAAFDWILARLLASRHPKAKSQYDVSKKSSPHWGNFAGLAAVLLAVGIANQVIPPWQPDQYPTSPRITLPATLEGSPPRGLEHRRAFLGSVSFTNSSNLEYKIDGVPVAIAVYADARSDRHQSLLSPKNALPGPGWAVESTEKTELYPGGGEVKATVLRSGNQRLLSYFWYEGLRSRGDEVFRNALGVEQSPWRRDGTLLAIRMSTPIRFTSDGLEAARSRLARAARGLEETQR